MQCIVSAGVSVMQLSIATACCNLWTWCLTQCSFCKSSSCFIKEPAQHPTCVGVSCEQWVRHQAPDVVTLARPLHPCCGVRASLPQSYITHTSPASWHHAAHDRVWAIQDSLQQPQQEMLEEDQVQEDGEEAHQGHRQAVLQVGWWVILKVKQFLKLTHGIHLQ